MIVLPLDDHLGQADGVVGAGDEAANEDVLDGRFGGAQAAVEIGWWMEVERDEFWDMAECDYYMCNICICLNEKQIQINDEC